MCPNVSITEEVDPEGGEARGTEGTKLKCGRGKAAQGRRPELGQGVFGVLSTKGPRDELALPGPSYL